ncbi:MAG: flagellar hook-associated protein FlgL [Anaerolineae bacterium]|jgi:flagellar hook-associated protein 3 FlgL
MRITHRMLVRTALDDLRSGMARMARYQEQLATGKAIHRPSDDPFGIQRSIRFRSELQALEVCQRNIGLAKDWVNATDVALEKLTDVLISAQNLALRGADDSVGTEARQAAGMEAAQLLGSALQCANSGGYGRYLFAGYKIDRPPFVGLDAASNPTEDPAEIVAVQYKGDAGEIERELEPGVSLRINIDGQVPWLDPSNPDSVFPLLIDLRDALCSGDGDAVRAVLGRFEDVLQTVTTAWATVGAKAQRLTMAQDKLEAVSLGLKELLSKTEDVDMAEAVVNSSQAAAVQQAALQVNARILPVSLLDYLR